MIMCYYGRFRVKLIAISMTIIFLLTNNIISISAVRIDLEIGSAVFNEMVSNGENKNNNNYHWALLIDSKGDLFPTMKDVLCLNGWQSDHIKTLEGEEATKDNVYNSFQWLDSMEDSEDTVLFYFHGHGGDGKFALYDGFMSYGELDEKLDELESESIAVIIDSCHSGSAIEYLSQNGRVIITSAKASETSGSFRLTDSLFEGLEELADYLFRGNNDGFVSAEEAFCYVVNTEFWKYSTCGSHGQTPQIDDKYDGELQITNISYRDDQLDQYQCLDSDVGSTIYCITDETWLAQSFKPGVKNITRIELRLHRFRNPGDLVVSIRKSLNGSDLAVLTVPQDSTLSWSRLIEFDFEDISVTPWNTYYILCRAPNGGRNDRYEWSSCEETYSRGTGFITEDGGESWEYLNQKFWSDFCFFVFGKEKTQEKPPTPPLIIAGPKYGRIDHKYTYRADFTGQGPVYYKFSRGDGTYSGWLGPYNSSESCEAKHAYGISGTYRIRVMVKDSIDVESDWSTELNVCIMEPVLIIGTVSDLSENENYTHIKPGTLLYYCSKPSKYGKFSILSRLCDIFPYLGFLLRPWDIIVSKEHHGYLGSRFIFGRFNALMLTPDEPID